MSDVNSIPVRDANGDELTVYEFQDQRFTRKVRRLKPCTSEAVEDADEARSCCRALARGLRVSGRREEIAS